NDNGNFDVLDLSSFDTGIFTGGQQLGSQILFDPAFTNQVEFQFTGEDTLTLWDFSQFEQVVFQNQSFDNDDDPLDLETNFTDFINATKTDIRTTVTGTTGNDTFISTAADEYFDLIAGSGDVIQLNVGSIGNDSTRTPFTTTGGLNVIIDFSGLDPQGQGQVIEDVTVRPFTSADDNDIIIDITYQDGLISFKESLIVNEALVQFGNVDTITVIDTGGTSNVLFADTASLRSHIHLQRVTEGDDVFIGLPINVPDAFTGGQGRDTIGSGGGNDLITFFAGDEYLSVSTGGGTDTIEIHGYSIGDAILRRSELDRNDLVIDFGDDQLIVQEHFGASQTENVIFEADTVEPDAYTLSTLTFEYLSGISTLEGELLKGGNNSLDTLIGGQNNDTLGGTPGRDTLDGGDQSDIYRVFQGQGDHYIRETGDRDTDRIEFDVASTDVTFSQSEIDPNNFFLTLADGTEIEIFNFLEGNDGKIEFFDFTDTSLDTTAARIRAFSDLVSNGDDIIVGGSTDDTLTGGQGNDFLNGEGGDDVFIYNAGDGDDTLSNDGGGANSFELIQFIGISQTEVTYSRVKGSRELNSGVPSQDEDLLIEFAGGGSITLINGLRQSSDDNRIEFVDEGAFVSEAEIWRQVIETEAANGVFLSEGPSTGDIDMNLNGGAAQTETGDAIYRYDRGDGELTILDETPLEDTQQLIITGYNLADASFRRLAAGSEDFIIQLPDAGDQIIVIGAVDSGSPVNGVNEVVFDDQTLDDAAITALLDTVGVGGAPPPIVGGAPIANGSGGGAVVISSDSDDGSGAVAPQPSMADLMALDNHMVFGDGDNMVYLGDGDDRAELRRGGDFANGQRGDDTLMGGLGADTLVGGLGDDELHGQAGRDKLLGLAGADLLKGGAGADRLAGGVGADTLEGGGGRDVLLGGKGADVLTGGGGLDRFVFKAKEGRDTVTDFNAKGEKLDFKQHSGVEAFGDLNITQNGSDVVIKDGKGGRIILEDTDIADISASDFIF
ncbi:MAG: calcium-binding protein, partial [Pseudomonadota bacterium]